MPKRDQKKGKPTAPATLAGTASLLGTARGQILSALCGRRLTALELAERFSVSSNAIRMHLTALHEAHLVHYVSETRGVGKPTHVYELTPEGQYFLSRAYAPALASVLHAVRARIPEQLDEMIRDAGKALATTRATRADRNSSLESKAERCAAMLRALGGSAEVVKVSGGLAIRSECCPLGSVVSEQPSACKLFEGLAEQITGRTVHEHCERTHRPHCRFTIS